MRIIADAYEHDERIFLDGASVNIYNNSVKGMPKKV